MELKKTLAFVRRDGETGIFTELRAEATLVCKCGHERIAPGMTTMIPDEHLETAADSISAQIGRPVSCDECGSMESIPASARKRIAAAVLSKASDSISCA